MSKDCRKAAHSRVVALPPYFEIRAACQRGTNANQQVMRAYCRNLHSFDFQIFAAMQNGRHHVSVTRRNHGKITTLRESSTGWEATVKACSIASNGKRCDISSRSKA